MGFAHILSTLLKVLVSRNKRIVNWEVVDSKVVEPVHLWDLEDGVCFKLYVLEDDGSNDDNLV